MLKMGPVHSDPRSADDAASSAIGILGLLYGTVSPYQTYKME